MQERMEAAAGMPLSEAGFGCGRMHPESNGPLQVLHQLSQQTYGHKLVFFSLSKLVFFSLSNGNVISAATTCDPERSHVTRNRNQCFSDSFSF